MSCYQKKSVISTISFFPVHFSLNKEALQVKRKKISWGVNNISTDLLYSRGSLCFRLKQKKNPNWKVIQKKPKWIPDKKINAFICIYFFLDRYSISSNETQREKINILDFFLETTFFTRIKLVTFDLIDFLLQKRLSWKSSLSFHYSLSDFIKSGDYFLLKKDLVLESSSSILRCRHK